MAPLSGALLRGGGSSGLGGAHKAPPPVLPFGPTLHYTGCGCPYNWAPGCRLCDWGDSWLAQAHRSMAPQPGQVHLAPIRKLKVGFCIPHANVTGGLKMLLEQMRLLRQRGHRIVALTRSELAASAVPAWSDVQVDEDIVCGLNQRFRDCYDVDSCDVIMTGIFHQVPEWLTSTSAPVLYYEQGHEWLFGDPVRFCEEGNYAAQDQLFHMAMHLPVAVAAVSEAVQSIICREFGRSSLLVHNGIDCQRFRPGPRDAVALASPARVLGPPSGQVAQPGGRPLPSVLLVGNPALSLKGFDCALATLALVQRSRPVEVHWVCQQEPPEQLAALIRGSGLRICLHISPPQADIPALYRGHDCFLFTSQYEAWGMPVLEAMASGLPVVCTATAGVSSFATSSVDCLMAPAGEPAELAQHVLSVLEDASLAARLAAAARQTAQRYTPDRAIAQLERVLYSLTACRQELMALRLQAMPDSQLAAAAAVRACAGAAAAHKAALKARQQREAAALAAGGLQVLGAAAAQGAKTSRPGAAAQLSAPELAQSLVQQQQQQQQTQTQTSGQAEQEARAQAPQQHEMPDQPASRASLPASASAVSLAGSSSSAGTHQQSAG
ncbi:hypothetical protein ABPG75_005454 [Micractinium tetrahymenae]